MAKANHTPSVRMAALTLKPIRNLTPIRLWDSFNGGLKYAFEDTEEAIRSSGLVPEWMPYPSKGVRSCIRRDEPHFVKLSRLKEGRLRLWISADLVTSSDKGFRDFLGALLADTRLSLVKGESA